MTIQTILMATDFSQPADAAMRQAAGLAKRLGAKLALLHVSETEQPPAQLPPAVRAVADTYEQMRKSWNDDLRKRLDDVAEGLRADGLDVSTTMVEGHCDQQIAVVAEKLGADLTVVGTHGRTGLRRFALGSAAERAVRHADGPVLVVRGEPTDVGRYNRILVPVDFSDYTRLAIDLALEMVGSVGRIELFHAWQLPPISWVDEPSLTDWTPLRDGILQANEQLGEALVADTAAPPGVQMWFSQRETKPSTGIQHHVEDGGHDLVVMGSHGRRGFRRWVLGSVAELVVRHAPCSVLVAHAAD